MAETRHTNDPVSGERVTIRNDLTKRLRGIYASGPTLANGEPEFGWRKMGEPPPIQVEAAEEIERLRTLVAWVDETPESRAAQFRNAIAALDRTRGEARCALKSLISAYVRLLESGRDRITSLGGDCDTVEKMESGDPDLIAAKAVLSTLT